MMLSPVQSTLIMEALRRIDERGYSCFIMSPASEEQELEAMAEFVARSVAGVLAYHPRNLPPHEHFPLPLVTVGAKEGAFDLNVDYEYGTMLALEHFYRCHQCRNIVFFADHCMGNFPKHKAYLEFCSAHRMPVRIIETRYEDPHRERVVEWVRNHEADAFFCSNDILAGQLIHYLTRRGVSIPGEAKICGFGGALLTKTSQLQLSAVVHPSEALAHESVELLFRKIAGKTLHVTKNPRRIKPIFFRGESCGCAGSEKPLPYLNVMREHFFFENGGDEPSDEEIQQCFDR